MKVLLTHTVELAKFEVLPAVLLKIQFEILDVYERSWLIL
jgi:hypothetical protein